MFWYYLKLWQIFKMKHRIWKNFCTFKNSYFSKFDCKKKKRHIGAIINTIYIRFQNISFEKISLGNLFWKNNFFGKKDLKEDNSPKCKVNTLAHYMSFGPFSITLCNMTQFSSCVLRHLMCFNHQNYVFLFTHINISAFQCDEIIKWHNL
jgi:hypothetical protein